MLVDRLQGLAARRPLLVTLEDVHWADATTLEVLRLLLARVDTAAMLVVITCRPEALPAMPTPPSLIHLTLGGLDRTAVEAMVRRLAPARKLPAALIEAILLRTDGVPLFVEELTKALASAAGTIGQPQPRRCRHHFTTR
jgi:predicted ATPase